MGDVGIDLEIMDELMSESKGSYKYVRKQLDFDAIMALDKEKRDVILNLINSNGRLTSEIYVMLETGGFIIDEREGKINDLLKG